MYYSMFRYLAQYNAPVNVNPKLPSHTQGILTDPKFDCQNPLSPLISISEFLPNPSTLRQYLYYFIMSKSHYRSSKVPSAGGENVVRISWVPQGGEGWGFTWTGA